MVGCVHHIYPAQESGREFSSPSRENSRVDCWLWVRNVSHFSLNIFFFGVFVCGPMMMMMFNSMDNEGKNGKNLAHTYAKVWRVRSRCLNCPPQSFSPELIDTTRLVNDDVNRTQVNL